MYLLKPCIVVTLTPSYPQGPLTASAEDLVERIKDGMYKRGVRTTEFFRDFDKRRSGLITENQVYIIHMLLIVT